MKAKLSAVIEIALVYTMIRMIGNALRSTGIVNWELEQLGWTYTGMLVFVGVPALFLLITRRDWTEYGVNLKDWQWDLDLGIKAYLVRLVPVSVFLAVTLWVGMDYRNLPGGSLIAAGEILGIAVMLGVLNRSHPEKAIAAVHTNIVVMILLLLFPILLAAVMRKLFLMVILTVLWQFFFSGFGEEFVFRGYVQTRLNQAFGRPYHLFGIQFGVSLLITSFLFGLFHAFNTFDAQIGFHSLSWGWALFTVFSGLLFGILRERTHSLLAPGLAHGLPDAVGEALRILFGWT